MADDITSFELFIFILNSFTINYAIWRAAYAFSTINIPARTEKYLNRFYFRMSFLFHVIFGTIYYTYKTADKKSGIISFIFFLQISFLCCSLVFLVKSILDFAGFSGGPILYPRKFYRYTSETIALVYFVTSLASNFYINNGENLTFEIKTMKIISAFILELYNIGLISIPSLNFIYSIYKADITNDKIHVVVFGAVFFAFYISVNVLSLILTVIKENGGSLSLIMAQETVDTLECLVICVTQDMIDWILSYIQGYEILNIN